MHIHILGICGTFMGSLALLARDLGHTVTGSDANVYPPMSTQLEDAGIEIMQGYDASHLQPQPDLVVVGNAMKRGIDAVEYMLNNGIPYTSGPQFLSEQVLQSRHVLAVAGTHGKTTTTTMLAWVLQYNNIDTGFLIGGVPIIGAVDSTVDSDVGNDKSDVAHKDTERLHQAFAHSSHLGARTATETSYFVIEADEYDSAFFDKRSKFVHYRPTTAILNNLEFDHADIFADLDAIQTQFHHMIRMIPSNGRIIMPADTASLEATIDKGCWTPIWRSTLRTTLTDTTNNSLAQDNTKDEHHQEQQEEKEQWQVRLDNNDGSEFTVQYMSSDAEPQTATVTWGMSGTHNVNNGVMAIAAAVDVGVSVADACTALSHFAGIKRRMELIGNINGIQVYDDFAHHPTAIETTLDGARNKLIGIKNDESPKLWAIIEPRSNTMKMGIHRDSLANSCVLADEVLWYEPAGLEWGLTDVINDATVNNIQTVYNTTNDMINHITSHAKSGDVVVIMSNGGFEGIHQKLVTALKQ